MFRPPAGARAGPSVGPPPQGLQCHPHPDLLTALKGGSGLGLDASQRGKLSVGSQPTARGLELTDRRKDTWQGALPTHNHGGAC